MTWANGTLTPENRYIHASLMPSSTLGSATAGRFMVFSQDITAGAFRVAPGISCSPVEAIKRSVSLHQIGSDGIAS